VVDKAFLTVSDIDTHSDLNLQAVSVDRGDAVRSALLGESHGVAIDHSAVQQAGGHNAEMAAVTQSLAGQQPVDHSAPVELLHATEMPAEAFAQHAAPTADGIVMPSAEQLSAMGDARAALAGEHGGMSELRAVLGDALAGGNHGPGMDAIIDAVRANAQGGGESLRAGAEAIANHAGTASEVLAIHAEGAVSGWDSAGFGGFQHAQAYSMEAIAAHPDAAPAAHAG
jgi:hypothetical protein